MSSFYLLLSCATTIFCCIQFSSAGNNDTDRLALLQIKAGIISDPLGVTNSWNIGITPSSFVNGMGFYVVIDTQG